MVWGCDYSSVAMESDLCQHLFPVPTDKRRSLEHTIRGRTGIIQQLSPPDRNCFCNCRIW